MQLCLQLHFLACMAWGSKLRGLLHTNKLMSPGLRFRFRVLGFSLRVVV